MYFLYLGRNHTRSYKQFIRKFVSLNYRQNIIMKYGIVNYLRSELRQENATPSDVRVKGGYSAPLYRHWGPVQAVRPIGGVEVQLYPFLTKGTRRGKGSASRPDRFLPPGKTRYPLYRELGGPQGRSGQVRKISPPPEFDPRTVQPVTSRYTDYATRPTPSDVYLI
jgi:hypothetical protein